ncbi:MAG: glycosyltransferase [Clostridium sp.]|uniref:glycosyltransferase n=1 Tax=Cetobacterium sp. TaxID=2071632 RepID=UPI003F355DE4
MKKKILFMLSTMNIGGVEKSFLSLLEYLPKENYDITLLLLEKKGGFLNHLPEHIKVEEVDWYKDIKLVIMNSPYDILKKYLNQKRYLKVIRFIFSYYLSKYLKDRFFYYKELGKDIPQKNESYDIAISYASPTEIIDYYILNNLNARKKIAWMHFDPSKINMNIKFYERLYKEFDKVFTVSEEGREKLLLKLKISNNKVKVFKNIVDDKLILKLSEEKIEDLDISDNTLKIVTLGRLGIEKGQDLGIKALNRLIRDDVNAHWYFIGDGLDREYYQKLVKELNLEKFVTFLGSKANPYPYLKMADIYVQTSRHEGYCIALAEAKVLNKLILTTDFTGAKEQIIDGYNGVICSADEFDIYEKLKKIIVNNLKI